MNTANEKTVPAVDQQELDAAETAAVISNDTYTHTFAKPFTFEGETFETLTFDFEKLTGLDSLAVEAELASMGKTALVPEVSADYLIRIAARACTTLRADGKRRLGSDFFMAMPLRDYARIRRMTRNFMLSSEL